MSNWLKKSRDQLQEHILDFLWRQWSSLGIAGTLKSNGNRIIDPESLLLFSLSICRYEPRLFDEIIDWLFQNGHFINVQRLQQIHKKYDFECKPQLSAIAELLSQKSKYRLKWSGLGGKYFQDDIEPLFFNKAGKSLSCGQEANTDPIFLRHGLKRVKINLSGYSQSLDMQSPACLLLKLRSLIGINARAELLCLLASEPEIQPNDAACKLSYYQKTVQTALLEMSLSGVIKSRRKKKEKYYMLMPGVLDSLLKPKDISPRWVVWPELLLVVEKFWLKLSYLSQIEIEPLQLKTELQQFINNLSDKYPDSVLSSIYLEFGNVDDIDTMVLRVVYLLCENL